MADASLSTYPTSVDTFNRISDLDENTLKKSNQYKKLVNAGNYAGAKAYLNDEGNSDLKQCAVSADIVNKHSDAIVAIENDIKDNVKSDISDINQSVNDIENKLGYNIGAITNGVRLSINDDWLDIKGYNRSKVSLSRGGASDPDSINIRTPYFMCENLKNEPPGVRIGYDKSLHFGDTSAFDLYEACFYHSGSKFMDADTIIKCRVDGTEWRYPTGDTTMTSEYYPFAVEGGIRTTQNRWFPFGYNNGSISVNAYFNRYSSDSDRIELIVECTGINKENIECTCGIIKYYIQ